MEQQNFKKKMEKEISSLPLEKKTRKCWKCLILSCTVMHKILSKRHALMLIMQQIQILRIRNMVCTFSKIDKHYQTQKQFNVRSVINVFFPANVFFLQHRRTVKAGHYAINKFCMQLSSVYLGQACNFIKNRLQHWCFPVSFVTEPRSSCSEVF